MILGRLSGLRRTWLVGAALAAAIVIGIVLVVVVRDGGASRSSESLASGGYVGGDFHSLVADPVVANRMFVGGHQAVSVSSDGGATWVTAFRAETYLRHVHFADARRGWLI